MINNEHCEVIFMAIALSMDALAVSICKGITIKKLTLKHTLKCGLYFGGFQAAMPIAGYFIGKTFASFISSFDHWVVFGILTALGLNMIVGVIREKEEEKKKHTSDFSHKSMFMLAIATSIDPWQSACPCS